MQDFSRGMAGAGLTLAILIALTFLTTLI